MPSAVVSRMAPRSSALAWPTADGCGGGERFGRVRRRRPRLRIGSAREDQASAESSSHEIVNRAARRSRPCACSGRCLRSGNRHRRAGIRRAGGVGDAGLDIERIETAGRFQGVQAVVSHLSEKRAVGIEHPVEPIDQHADRHQIEQHPVAPRLAARGRLGRRQPVGLFARLPLCFIRVRRLAGRAGRRVRCRGVSAILALEPRRQLPGELVEGAVFHRRQDRRFRFTDRPKRQTTFLGVSTGVSKSVCCEVSKPSALAIQSNWMTQRRLRAGPRPANR